MDPKSIWLMGWHDRMVEKHGHPDKQDWCRKLAYYMGEEGNDAPSEAAIVVAQLWEQELPKEW